MATKKKRRQDPKLIAAKQEQEIAYIAKTYKIPTKTVRKVVKEKGRSRKAVYAALRLLGYTIKTNRFQ